MAPEGTTNRSAAPADVISARMVLRAAALSSAGKVRLTTQAGNADEVGALALLTGNATALGEADAVVFNAALGSALTAESTLDDLVTAVAAS
jgi:hypothetical protein